MLFPHLFPAESPGPRRPGPEGGTTAAHRLLLLLLLVLAGPVAGRCGDGVSAADRSASDNSETAGDPPSPADALATITTRIPARVTVFAAEPTIRNPVAACSDPAGRLLVAENLTYAEKPLKTDLRFRDRVTILEDADGDGTAERKATLVDGLEGLASVAVGRGGLWLLCPPRLLFVPGGHQPPPGWPDAADTTEPARRRQAAVVVLDGFTVSPSSHHTFANGLVWGPDGWLYGRSGASSPGEIGPPGSTPAERVPLRGGIWRYHPERKVFEAICHGTTNPWGLDWDDLGNGFFTNTVNGHLWRVLPGAHYARSHTVEPHPWILEPLGAHADHDHFDSGRHWTESRDGRADAHGGGHAHTGCVIVPDEPGWPDALRGRLLTLNLHGRRINVDRLDAEPTGIVGRHEADLARFADPFFRGTDLLELPGHRIAVLDWSDTGECHEGTGVHRTSGRIYLFDVGTAAETAPVCDLSQLPSADLVARLSSDRRHARTALGLLADRHAAGTHAADLDGVLPALETLLSHGATPVLRLRGLWGLRAIERIDEPGLWSLLDDPEPAIRAWALRLLADTWPIDTVLGGRPTHDARLRGFTLDALERLALTETDPEVRLALACTLSRLPPSSRTRIAAALVSVTESAPIDESGDVDFGPPTGAVRAIGGDHHDLGAMILTGLLGAIPVDPEGVIDVWKAAWLPGAEESHWPGLRRSIAHRLTGTDALSTLPSLLAAASAEGPPGLDDCFGGLLAGWRGKRHVDAPTGWDEVRTTVAEIPTDDLRQPRLADTVARLDALFGDRRGTRRLSAVVGDPSLPTARRSLALEALVDVRADEAAGLARESLGEPGLALAAIRGLLVAGSDGDAHRLLEALPDLAPAARDAALSALASRASWGSTLVESIERGDLPPDTLTPLLVRQLGGLGQEALRTRIAPFVAPRGTAGPAVPTAASPIDAWKARLTPEHLAAADPAAGRAVWQRHCAACHRLHGEGGTLGPDLTGSGRRDLDYLLSNIVTPSATVSPDHAMKQVVLDDGRVLSGIIARRSPELILLRTPTGEETVPMEDVEEVVNGGVSLMPEGILDRLDDTEARALMRFLMEP
jgi:putative membrane-bound dehydrogenase-like protein